MEKKTKEKKPIYKKWWFWGIIVIVLMSLAGGEDDEKGEDVAKEGVTEESTEEKTEKSTETEEAKEEEDETSENIETFNITADLNIKFEDNKAVVTVTTNAMDGTLFETSIMDNQFNMVSNFISIENGEGIEEFEIPEEWEVGYVSGLSMLRFNLDDHPQPDNVKELYGENGENLEGDLIVENNLGGYNVSLETVTIPYPDKETVIAKQDELFVDAMNELIDVSEGVIVEIQPHFEAGDWSSVAVIVSDAWYYSAEYEKERFAEQVAETIKQVVQSTEKVGQGTSVSVYFYDIYKKELASPKIFGGYKIKE